MRRSLRRILGTAGTSAALVGALVAPAQAAEYNNSQSTINYDVPIVHTSTNGPVRANLLNPRPVCNHGDYRTTVTRVSDTFKPYGAIETTNDTREPMALSQTLSQQKTVSASVTGDVGGQFSGVTAKISATISRQMSWSVGQTIGPFQVPVGHSARATYGFRITSFSGTQQRCRLNGTWGPAWTFKGHAPRTLAVQFDVFDDPTDLVPGGKN